MPPDPAPPPVVGPRSEMLGLSAVAPSMLLLGLAAAMLIAGSVLYGATTPGDPAAAACRAAYDRFKTAMAIPGLTYAPDILASRQESQGVACTARGWLAGNQGGMDVSWGITPAGRLLPLGAAPFR